MKCASNPIPGLFLHHPFWNPLDFSFASIIPTELIRPIGLQSDLQRNER